MLKPLATVALVCVATASSADDFLPLMESFYESEVSALAADPMILSAIVEANAHSAGYDQATIDGLDTAWRAEVGGSDTPTISPILDNAASAHLRDLVAAAGGTITEIIVMDSHGLNAAVSDVTSDMWQGDEEKYSETYAVGPDAVHYSEVEFDESTQTYQGQISLTIVDPATGAPVGALTVGVNVDAL